MKKTFLLTALFFSFVCNTFSQKKNKLKFSMGADVGYVATVDLAVFWGTGIGVSAQAEYILSDKISATLTAGYAAYQGVSIFGGDKQDAVKTAPVRLGARYYIVGRLYIAADAGIGFLNSRGIGATNTYQFNGGSFSYSPQLGYQFMIKGKRHIDLTFRYEGYNKSPVNFTTAGARLAYIF
jgi:hypothetical protein